MDIEKLWVEFEQVTGGWQAVFACQVCLRPFSELNAMRWGFNAQALLGEAQDRQKLFLESQYLQNSFDEDPEDRRIIALRCIRLPGTGLLLALIGKVFHTEKEQARRKAIQGCRELISTFPTDYKIYPALTQSWFDQLTGKNILAQCLQPESLAKITRFEHALHTKSYIFGFWQNTDRSDEQIWRTLGNFPEPALFNISLRPTRLDIHERQVLWDMLHQPPAADKVSPLHTAQPLDKWAEPLINRRLSPWKKFYSLQVHLACPTGVPDTLTRPIGSAITRETPDLVAPGYLTHRPDSLKMAQKWRENLLQVEILPSEISSISLARLSDMADLSETVAVFRLPYPPEQGLPEVKFVEKLE